MKNILLSMLVILTMASCITQRVRDNTLLPAIASAWVDVRADVVYADGLDDDELALWDSAVTSGTFSGLDVQDLVMHAISGVNLRLQDGLIGVVGAGIMQDRAFEFGQAVEEYRRGFLVARAIEPNDRPLVISRSSWATHPPSAIAARTYR